MLLYSISQGHNTVGTKYIYHQLIWFPKTRAFARCTVSRERSYFFKRGGGALASCGRGNVTCSPYYDHAGAAFLLPFQPEHIRARW